MYYKSDFLNEIQVAGLIFLKWINTILSSYLVIENIQNKIIPKNCIKFVWVLKIIHEKNIINSGVIEVIIEELITIDVWRDK